MAMDVIPDPIKAAVNAAMQECPTRQIDNGRGGKVDWPCLDPSECERMMRVGMRAYFECLLNEAMNP